MNTYLQQIRSWKLLHFICIFFVKLVFEHLAVHHVLVLVNQSAHAWLGAFVLVPDHVEGVAAVRVDTTRNYEFVESTFLDWVDFSVYVEFDLQLEGLAGGSDPWD